MAHNGLPFDFVFLVAEVNHRKLNEIFNSIPLYFADTLHDAKRVSCNALHMIQIHGFVNVKIGDPLFAEWSSAEQNRLVLENLFKKCYPSETYNGT